MNSKKNHSASAVQVDPQRLQLRLVSRIALLTGFVSAALLIISVFYLSSRSGEDYFSVIYAHSITQKNLPPVMFLTGLGLLSLTGFITWIISLYTSFRIAGPLYRFSKNFERAADHTQLPGLRKGDALQALSDRFSKTTQTLHGHYFDIGELAEKLKSQLDTTESAEELNKTVAEMKQKLGCIRIDD